MSELPKGTLIFMEGMTPSGDNLLMPFNIRMKRGRSTMILPAESYWDGAGIPTGRVYLHNDHPVIKRTTGGFNLVKYWNGETE